MKRPPHDSPPNPVRRLWRALPEGLRRPLRESRLMQSCRAAARRMRGLGSIEEEHYFQKVERTTSASVGAITEAMIATYAPRSVFDAGCGTGVLLDHLRSRGVRVSGVEYADIPLRYCRRRKLDVQWCDLRAGLSTDGRATDLAICVEVAHQLPVESGLRLVESLCKIAPVVVFSANPPGSDDRVRLNLQPHEWWIEKFQRQGFHLNRNVTDRWRVQWRQAGAAPWFHSNTMVFERDDGCRTSRAEHRSSANAGAGD